MSIANFRRLSLVLTVLYGVTWLSQMNVNFVVCLIAYTLMYKPFYTINEKVVSDFFNSRTELC